jgi:hypothetical protein
MPAPSRPRALDFAEEERPVRTERPDDRVLPVDADTAEVADCSAGAAPQLSQ